MKIKNVRKTIKKNKKTVASVALLGLSLILTSCETKQDRINALEIENQRLQDQYDDLASNFTIEYPKNCYYMNDLMAVVTNDKDGTPEYRFVEDNFIDANFEYGQNLAIKENVYVSITTPGLTYPNLEYKHTYARNRVTFYYNTVRESRRIKECTVYGGWIPDYKIEQSVIHDITNLPLPKEYQNQTSFTKEELKEIENAMNNNCVDAIEEVKQQEFELRNLCYVLTDENTGFIVDQSTYLEVLEATDPFDVYSFQNNFYFYSITNPMRGLKLDTNEPAVFYDSKEKHTNENSIYEVVSLDPNDEILNPVKNVYSILELEDLDAVKQYGDMAELSYEKIKKLEDV